MKLRVLSFHNISSNRDELKRYPGISTPYITFILLMILLRICRFKFCLFNELPRFSKRRVIILNFDDAYYSVYKKAHRVLSFLGIKAHVCITGESITGPVRENKLKLMDISEAIDLQNKGWDFINHTMHHTALVNKNDRELNDEITKTAEEFKKNGLFLNPDFCCLPEGKSDSMSEQFIFKSGYKYILTTLEDQWDTHLPGSFVPRINLSSQALWYAFYKIVFKYSDGKTTSQNQSGIVNA